MKSKATILPIFIILLASVALPQPSRPNNVWGEATDSATENPVPNLDIEAYKSGSSIGSTTTDASGDYDFNIPADKASEGDNIDLYVDGSDSGKDISYQIGGVYNVDFSGEYGLKVGLEDASVDEGNNVGLSPTVSNAENPSYTWTFPNDNKGASISGSGSSVQFQAPSDVDSDTDVDVEVQVSNEAGEVASDTATVTIEDTDAEQEDGTGGGGGSGGSIDSNLTDDEDEQDGEGIQADDNQTEDDETGDSQDDQAGEDPVRQVDASTENGSAEAEIERVEPNENIQVNIPDSIESGDSSVESVIFSSSTEASDVSVEVSEYGKSFEKVSEKLDNKKPKGKVYSYQDITVSNVEDDSIGKASVNFKVKKSFIEENDGSVGDVRLSRFKDGGWEAFEAESIGETDTYYRMESQVPGFSTFAVTLVDDESGSGLPLIPLVLALVLVIASVALYRFRDEIEEFMAGSNEGRESESEDYSFN